MRCERGGSQLMQILGLLGMYFDAVVVFVTPHFYSDSKTVLLLGFSFASKQSFDQSENFGIQI